MGKVYITGDKHGSYTDVREWCEVHGTTRDDLLIVLGDNGVNFRGPGHDYRLKEKLAKYPITFFMIKGNHDMRPPRTLYQPSFAPHPLYNGAVLVERKYSNQLFAYEHGFYRFNTANGWKSAYVLGGAYSVDKWYRLEMMALGKIGYRWFRDEQLGEEEMKDAEKSMELITAKEKKIDLILSHTCPEKYIPTDMFIDAFKNEEVDRTMEKWMDHIEETIPYGEWYCGHWHTDRFIDRMRFMYNDIIELE